MSVPEPRGAFVARVLRHHVALAVAAVRGVEVTSGFTGDLSEGRAVYVDGSGNHLAVAWNQTDLVALAYDHDFGEGEHEVPPAGRRPGRWTKQAPGALAPLVKIVERAVDRLATGALWTEAGRIESEGAIDPLRMYLPDGDDPVRSVGLEGPHALAMDRLGPRLGAPLTVDAEDEELLLAEGHPSRITAASVERARKLLAQLGVAWPTSSAAAARAEARQAEADDRALGPWGKALFDATVAGDATAIAELVQKGADPDVAHPAVWKAPLGPGDTPLSVAARLGHVAALEALLAAGADPDRGGGKRPLELAVNRGDAAACRALLARGASVETDVQSLLAACRSHGNLEIVRMLLDAGAALSVQRRCWSTSRTFATSRRSTSSIGRRPAASTGRSSCAASRRRSPWRGGFSMSCAHLPPPTVRRSCST
jgi:hypothetical protein